MDLTTVFILLVPLIALYVRAPAVLLTRSEALSRVGLVLAASAALTLVWVLLVRFVLAPRNRARPASAPWRRTVAGSSFLFLLLLLFLLDVQQLAWKEAFARLFFSSEWYLVSDLLLLLPFFGPFLLFRTEAAREVVLARDGTTPYLGVLRRQLRWLSVMLAPQLLYLNTYRLLADDVPVFSPWLHEHPLYALVLSVLLVWLLFLLSPYSMRLLFARVPLEEFPGGQAVLDALARSARDTGIGIARAFVWLTGEARVATAAVAGVVRRNRTLLATDRLVESLSPPEILAVVAHEVGHARYHHLVFNFLLALASGVFVLAGVMLLLGEVEDQDTLALMVIALQVVFVGGVLGPVVRGFERQADHFAAVVTGGPEPLAGALYRLARLNGMPLRRGSLTHPSPCARIERLLGMAARPPETLRSEIRQNRQANLALAAALLLVITAAALWLGTSELM